MRRIADIDILGDRALQLKVNALAIAVAGAGVAGTVVAACAGAAEFRLSWLLPAGVAYLVSLPAHELVHAAAFKLLAPGRRLIFGFEGGFLYVGCPGAVLTRARMAVVMLAPAVVVTAALVAAACALGAPATAWLLAALHLAGCSGDVLMTWEALRATGCTHVEDTDCGVVLLADDEGAGA